MKRIGLFAASAAAAWTLSGCANSAVETTVNPDGSWKRKVELRATRPDENKPGGGMTIGPDLKLDQIFALPQGPAWTVKRSRDGQEDVVTIERKLQAGEELTGDLVLKTDPKKGAAGPRIEDRVTVRRLAPDRWEYREVLHWTGPRAGAFEIPKDLGPVESRDFLAWTRAALPPRLATDANAARFAQEFAYGFVQELFGPPDPLLDQIMAGPGQARFRLSLHLSPMVSRALASAFGDQLTGEERAQATRKIVAQAGEKMTAFREKQQGGAGPPSGGGPGDDGPPPVFMSYTVSLPGRVVETNGIRDDLMNTVSWGLYSWSPIVRDVELRAVCETRQVAAAPR